MGANSTAQLDLDAPLGEAAPANRTHALQRRTAHVPATMEGALPYSRQLLEMHHAAMLAADVDTVMALRAEARDLALRRNRGAPGILAGPSASGCRLERETAAAPGAIHLWGARARRP